MTTQFVHFLCIPTHRIGGKEGTQSQMKAVKNLVCFSSFHSSFIHIQCLSTWVSLLNFFLEKTSFNGDNKLKLTWKSHPWFFHSLRFNKVKQNTSKFNAQYRYTNIIPNVDTIYHETANKNPLTKIKHVIVESPLQTATSEIVKKKSKT